MRLWSEAAAAMVSIVDAILIPQVKPVRELSATEIKELIAHGNKKKNQYESRDDGDGRYIFEFVRDTYSKCYPGIRMEHLKSSDLLLWQNLSARRTRAKKGAAAIPDWFDVPYAVAVATTQTISPIVAKTIAPLAAPVAIR